MQQNGLTNEELVERIQAGEREYIAQLWEQVQPFVILYANRWGRTIHGLETDDLIQTGFLAVVDATENFDPSKECKFLTLLDAYLKKHFQTACAAASGWSRGVYDRRAELGLFVGSLNQPAKESESDSTEIGDMLPSPDRFMEDMETRIYREQLHEQMARALAQLPAEERQTLHKRYFEGLTIQDTCRVLETTKARLELLERHGLRKLKNDKRLQEFVEDNTDYYLHIGVRAFQGSNESAVEKIVLRREKIRQKWYELRAGNGA